MNFFRSRRRFLPVLAVLAPLSALAVWLTFTSATAWQGLSGHAAAAAAIVVWTVALALYDRYPSREIDFFHEMKEGNLAAATGFAAIALCIALLVLGAISVITVPVASAPPPPPAPQPATPQAAPDTSAIAPPPDTATAALVGPAAAPSASPPDRTPAHLDTALTYTWVREQGENRGPGVKTFLASVGLDEGYAWCAAAVSYILDAGGARSPTVRHAATRMFRPTAHYTQGDVLNGRKLPPGALTIHRYSRFKGHIGILAEHEGRGRASLLHTVEGNTSCPRTAQAPAGEGMCRKTRRLVGSNYLAPVLFTAVQY